MFTFFRAPKVSVVIATYNWSGVLRHAIKSALRQTLRDFEMLVVGDGCTGDSGAVVASFKDKRVRWHNLKRNHGHQSAPNNQGLAMARGQYVAYLGHDDLWHPRHLECLVRALETTGADVAYSLTAQVGPPGSGVRVLRGVSPDGQYHADAVPPPSSLLHRRAMTAEVGGWADYRTIAAQPEDDLLRRAQRAGKRFAPVPELTVWKFPSTWRPLSYVEKPCQEQADWLRRMGEEPDFLCREALDCAIAATLQRTGVDSGIHWPGSPAEMPPGWLINEHRRVRGLDPLGPEPTE